MHLEQVNMNSGQIKNLLFSTVAVITIGAAQKTFAQAGGALDSALSSRAISLGGTTTASSASPLEAMQGNPATLTELRGRSVDISATSLFATGSFRNSVSNDGSIVTSAGTLPYGAFSMPLGSGRWHIGFASAPELLMYSNWKYIDPPGGLGGNVSYGLQQNKSGILVLRSSAGVGYVVNRKLSIGGTFGALYNSNTLHSPYIFQEQATLAGAKTLLDLHTSGIGWNGTFGALITPSSKLKVGFAYKMSTTIRSHGNANGNVGAQWAALGAPFRPDFHYNAEVDNNFPQAFSGGVSWQVHPRARLNLQSSFINWGNSFKSLPVKLSNGNNDDINTLVGGNSLQDAVPLHWRNQGTFGAGVESPVGEHFAFRGGYSYATNPVPSGTLTPMTAAILQHTIGTGVGYSRGRYAVDLAYALQLPSSSEVGLSSLRSGEYNNSKVEVAVHSVTLTNRFSF
jgi:long-chain fatty acid transport protein